MSPRLPQRLGKYPVLREIGSGATSRVYLARDPFAARDVAATSSSALSDRHPSASFACLWTPLPISRTICPFLYGVDP